MGDKLYTAIDYYQHLIKTDSIIVEIGSERGEGSSSYFINIADKNKTHFYTVDIVENKIAETEFVHKYQMSGEQFSTQILPFIGKKISILYLDNFDWMWDPNLITDYQDQIDLYKSKGYEMNNLNSSLTHLKQLIAIEPYLDEECVVICDDTYWLTNPGSYVGKCSAVVMYLLAKGWRVSHRSAVALCMLR